MNGDVQVYETLKMLDIKFEYIEHPPAPTIEEAMKYWKDIDSGHCKNLFFRNHKGNKHYLVILNAKEQLIIKDIESKLKQGKISFASEQRMQKYLGLKPGSVSPFGLIHDKNKEVTIFLDENLKNFEKLSFHPNLNTASLIISFADFMKYINWTGNKYEFIKLY